MTLSFDAEWIVVLCLPAKCLIVCFWMVQRDCFWCCCCCSPVWKSHPMLISNNANLFSIIQVHRFPFDSNSLCFLWFAWVDRVGSCSCVQPLLFFFTPETVTIRREATHFCISLSIVIHYYYYWYVILCYCCKLPYVVYVSGEKKHVVNSVCSLISVLSTGTELKQIKKNRIKE